MTARYVVCLYLAANPDVRVERALRRDSDGRAVSYAETWLHKHRLSMRYLGIAFDRWHLERLDDVAGLCEVASGVDTLPIPTATEQATRKAARETKLKVTGSVTSTRTPRSSVRRSTPSRPQGRLALAVAEAKRQVANNGNLPPLGGHPNR